MSTSLIPVRPARDAAGQLVSLKEFLHPPETTDASPYPASGLKASDLAERKTTVNFFYTSMRVATSLGIVSAASASVNGMYDIAVFDIVSGVYKIRTGDVEGHLVRSTLWGSAVRIVMRVRAMDSKIKGGFGLLAAGVEFGMAQVDYEVHLLGKPAIETMAVALEGIPLLGALNFDSYSRLRGASAKVIDRVTASLSVDQMNPIGVTISATIVPDTIAEAQSKRYAMSSIVRGRTLAVAIAQKPEHIDARIVRNVYAEIVADSPEILTSHRDNATRWIND